MALLVAILCGLITGCVAHSEVQLPSVQISLETLHDAPKKRGITAIVPPACITGATEFEQEIMMYYPEAAWICRSWQYMPISKVMGSLQTVIRLLGDPAARWFYIVDMEHQYDESKVIDDLVNECAQYELWMHVAYIDAEGLVSTNKGIQLQNIGMPASSVYSFVARLLPARLAELYQAYFELLGLQAIQLLALHRREREEIAKKELARKLDDIAKKLNDIASEVNGLQLPSTYQVIAQRMTYHKERFTDLIALRIGYLNLSSTEPEEWDDEQDSSDYR